jgi:uncharacterized protein (DUF433 family)
MRDQTGVINILTDGKLYSEYVGGHMEALLENLTTNEAAIVAGVTVANINRVIDRKILPKKLYSMSQGRTVRKDACVWIAFYFETADLLTSAARVKTIRDGLMHNHSWLELKDCRVEESRTVQVNFLHIWKDVERRLNQLKEAQAMVIEDSEILQGTPIIKGTRIPLFDVASLVDSGTAIEEILKIYPRLKKSQIELASIYAKANPQRGRPKRRTFPKCLEVSISK